MAKQKITGLSAALLEQQTESGDAHAETHLGTTFSSEPARPVVQTVKVPPDVFVRLKMVGARERRSSQDIILSALRAYLEQFPVES